MLHVVQYLMVDACRGAQNIVSDYEMAVGKRVQGFDC
jgi:hypothetical protein